MSTPAPPSNPTAIYIGAIAGIVALGLLVTFIRVARVNQIRREARQNALVNPAPHSVNLEAGTSSQPPWSTPAPPYSPSYPSPLLPLTTPSFNHTHPSVISPRTVPTPTEPQTQNQPSAVQTQVPPQMTLPYPPQQSEEFPLDQPQSMSLIDRMRQVQTLMLEIHRLETDSSGEIHRARIQELERRVIELSETENTPPSRSTATEVKEPPPYAMDGRGDP